MRVIFMGTPDFAVGTLKALAEAGHTVCLVVTQPDKPKGRGKEMQFPPVKEAAVEMEIPVYQPQRIRRPECVEELKKYNADVMVVVAFGQILPKEILDMTPYGCINVHASLLPKYRGAAPIQWAILNGETVTGVTTMQMDEGLDTGDMLLKTEVEITENDTGESLHDKLAEAGAKLCVETLAEAEAGNLHPEKQPDTPTMYAKMLDKTLGNIDWGKSAQEIERQVRGLTSWPGAYTHWKDKVLKIWKCQAAESNHIEETKNHTQICRQERVFAEKEIKPGTVIKVTKNQIAVQTGNGILLIDEVQMPGKKRMDTGAFLRGYSMESGTIFTV